MNQRLISISLLTFTLLFTGCMTSTRFHTKPAGAKVYINGDYVGESPVNFADSRGLPKRFHLQIRKEGYDDLDFYLDKSYDYLGLFLSGLYGLGTIAGSSLEADYHFNLAPLKKK